MRRAASRRRSARVLAGAAALAWLPAASAQLADDWSVTGYNTLRLEHYEASGNRALRPYPSLGGQVNDDLGLSFSRQPSPWERQQIRLDGTVNQSDYRGPERGLVLERASALWQKGDTTLPFRLDAGDFFAFQSPRTVQRGLKGLQLELQPRAAGAAHSLQGFVGLTDPTWRHLEDDRDWYAGLSWLMESEPLGAVNLNVVHNRREADAAAGRLEQAQSAVGLAWNRELELTGQRLELDAEYTRFAGDHSNGAARDRSDDGFYAQVRGMLETLPLDWRLRYERYGEDFRPAGGAVGADQERAEAHAAWRFDGGTTLRLRAQAFTDALESGNPVDTDVLGATLSGALLPGTGLDLSGSADAFVQSREDRAGSVDAGTRSLRLAASAPVHEAATARVGFAWTAGDAGAGSPQTVRRQISAGLDLDLARGPWRATLSPGLVWRHDTGGSARRDDWSPDVALTLDGRGHRVRLAWSTLDLDTHAPNGVDSLDHRASAAWSWTRGRHRFGLDADWSSRDPSPGADGEAWRVGATWTVSFERPAAGAAAPAPAAAPGVAAGPLRLAELAPDQPLDAAIARLARAGAGSPVSRPGLLVYETRLFDDVERRQRLALVHDGTALERAVAVVDLDARGDGLDGGRTFEQVREALLRRYGPADRRIEEGDFGPALAADLAAGRFVRLIEWRTRDGVLRFGIPERADGELRIELQHAAGFAPGERPDWSLARLR